MRDTSHWLSPPDDNSTVAAEIAFMMSIVRIPVILPSVVKLAKMVRGWFWTVGTWTRSLRIFFDNFDKTF